MKLPATFPSLTVVEPLLQPVMTAIAQMFGRVANVVNNPDFGATGARPTAQLVAGQTYFDTTLNKPIWYDGVDWVDATGADV